MTEGLFACWAYKIYGKFIVEERYLPAGQRAVNGLKDANLALAAGEADGVPLPSGNVWRDRLVGAVAHGEGEHDWAVMAQRPGARQRAGEVALPRVAWFYEASLPGLTRQSTFLLQAKMDHRVSVLCADPAMKEAGNQTNSALKSSTNFLIVIGSRLTMSRIGLVFSVEKPPFAVSFAISAYGRTASPADCALSAPARSAPASPAHSSPALPSTDENASANLAEADGLPVNS